MSNKVLEIDNLLMQFGGLKAVNNVSLEINKSEITSLIGPNGAGKTTFFNCLTGVYTPTAGDINIIAPGKKSIRANGLKPNKVTELGLARTFQNIRLFQDMTVLENVMIGRHPVTKAGVLGALFNGKKTREEEEKIISSSYDILKKMDLDQYANEFACNLPYGAQRLLEIARALATDPFLLLLDEPAAGMNPQETISLIGTIEKLKHEHNLSILLIEHDMHLVMNLSDMCYVMDYGKLIAKGTPEETSKNPTVIKAYLGEEF